MFQQGQIRFRARSGGVAVLLRNDGCATNLTSSSAPLRILSFEGSIQMQWQKTPFILGAFINMQKWRDAGKFEKVHEFNRYIRKVIALGTHDQKYSTFEKFSSYVNSWETWQERLFLQEKQQKTRTRMRCEVQEKISLPHLRATNSITQWLSPTHRLFPNQFSKVCQQCHLLWKGFNAAAWRSYVEGLHPPIWGLKVTGNRNKSHTSAIGKDSSMRLSNRLISYQVCARRHYNNICWSYCLRTVIMVKPDRWHQGGLWFGRRC